MANEPGREQALNDAGKLVLRLMLGVLLLFHGTSKVMNGIDGITAGVAQRGLPAELGYFVYFGEVVGPILLILGIATRIGALLVVANMLVAIALSHMAQLFTVSESGGYALELQALYLFTALAIAILGAGRYGLGGRYGRWN